MARTRSQPKSLAFDVRAGTHRCPRCGGTQFRARRATGRRFIVRFFVECVLWLSPDIGRGMADTVVTRKIACTTCGSQYDPIW
jgi:DNA-directed RNA polymerase subunit RPC12/RpoP